MVARKCQSSSNSSYAFFQFIRLKGVVAWLENDATTSLKSCGENDVHATTSLFSKLLAWKELWCRDYPRHNFLKKLWRGFLVTPQLLSVGWIGRRRETKWKKTGTYGSPYVVLFSVYLRFSASFIRYPFIWLSLVAMKMFCISFYYYTV